MSNLVFGSGPVFQLSLADNLVKEVRKGTQLLWPPPGGTDSYFRNVGLLLQPTTEENGSTVFKDRSRHDHPLVAFGSTAISTSSLHFGRPVISVNGPIKAPLNWSFDLRVLKVKCFEFWIHSFTSSTEKVVLISRGGFSLVLNNTPGSGDVALYVGPWTAYTNPYPQARAALINNYVNIRDGNPHCIQFYWRDGYPGPADAYITVDGRDVPSASLLSPLNLPGLGDDLYLFGNPADPSKNFVGTIGSFRYTTGYEPNFRETKPLMPFGYTDYPAYLYNLAIRNYQQWWDADDEQTVSALAATAWFSKSASSESKLLQSFGNDPSQPTGPLYNSYPFRSLWWPDADSNKYLRYDEPETPLRIREIYIVLQYGPWEPDLRATGWARSHGIFDTLDPESVQPNRWIISSGQYGLSSSGPFDRYYINGGDVNRASNVFPEMSRRCLLRAVTASDSLLETTSFMLGRRGYGNFGGWWGEIFEVRIYENPLDPADRLELETGLMRKWGIIPSSLSQPADPYFDSVDVLSSMSGSPATALDVVNNNSAYLPNDGPTRRTIRLYGYTDTFKSKWGGCAVLTGGLTGGYIEISAYMNLLSFGTSDFTIEGWFLFDKLNNTPSGLFHFSPVPNTSRLYPADTTEGLAVGMSNNTTITVYCGGTDFNFPFSPEVDQFYFVQLKRNMGIVRLLINGNQIGSSIPDNSSYTNLGRVIGCFYTLSYNLCGRVEEFRITTGVARPDEVPTAPFPRS